MFGRFLRLAQAKNLDVADRGLHFVTARNVLRRELPPRVGFVNAFGILAIPGAAVVLTFALMAVVLIVRPHGLFGTPE